MHSSNTCAPQTKKARNWFDRSVTVNPDNGDSWAFYYKFELEQGEPDTQAAVLKRCVEADPKHGEWWCSVSKKVRVEFLFILGVSISFLVIME